MFPDVLWDDHAVPIYKNAQPLNITFTVSKYASETLGQLLRKLRLQMGLEQWEVAKKLRVHRNSVYDWESDRHRPSGKSIERLAQFFRISIKKVGGFRIKTK